MSGISPSSVNSRIEALPPLRVAAALRRCLRPFRSAGAQLPLSQLKHHYAHSPTQSSPCPDAGTLYPEHSAVIGVYFWHANPPCFFRPYSFDALFPPLRFLLRSRSHSRKNLSLSDRSPDRRRCDPRPRWPHSF